MGMRFTSNLAVEFPSPRNLVTTWRRRRKLGYADSVYVYFGGPSFS